MRLQKAGLSTMLFLGVGFGLWACVDQTATEVNPAGTRTQVAAVGHSRSNPYAYVGVIHNQALDYAFHQLKRSSGQSRRTGGLDKDDYFRISGESLEEYFNERKVGRLYAEEVRSWREVLSRRPHASARELAGTLTLQPGEVPEGGVVLSPRAWDYLNEILFIADVAVDMGQLQNQLWDLEVRAASELSGTDLDAVYATTAVTLSSASYWESNYDQWASLCSSDPHACTFTEAPDGSGGPGIQRVDGWKVLGADVVGCVGGFLRGAWAGCAIGAGVSSTTSIIAQL